jgi:hypothetical protein
MTEELAVREEAWAEREVEVDGETIAAQMIEIDDAFAGYVLVGDRLACFGTVSLIASEIRLRSLTPSAASCYLANPLKSLSNKDLEAQDQSSS